MEVPSEEDLRCLLSSWDEADLGHLDEVCDLQGEKPKVWMGRFFAIQQNGKTCWLTWKKS